MQACSSWQHCRWYCVLMSADMQALALVLCPLHRLPCLSWSNVLLL